MATNPGSPYAWDVRGSIVEAKREARESRLLSSQEKRLWNITLSALEILFAPASESEEAEAKAWDEILTKDGDLDQLVWDIVGHLSQYIGLQAAMLKGDLRPEHAQGLNVRWQTIKAMVERFNEEVDE
jgi:hypothetical protein